MQVIAALADSCITSPREPVSSILPVPSITATSIGKISPPTEVHARPFTIPISSVFASESGINFLWPKSLSISFSSILNTSVPSVSFSTAHFLITEAISLSRVLTPASLV